MSTFVSTLSSYASSNVLIMCLGMVKHLTKVIILRSGMLNPIPRNDWYPLDRLEGFFSRIIWPVSVARLPPSVSFH